MKHKISIFKSYEKLSSRQLNQIYSVGSVYTPFSYLINAFEKEDLVLLKIRFGDKMFKVIKRKFNENLETKG